MFYFLYVFNYFYKKIQKISEMIRICSNQIRLHTVFILKAKKKVLENVYQRRSKAFLNG